MFFIDSFMDEPYWLEDYVSLGHKQNRDGTVDLYHGTTRETAVKMVQTQKMLTAPGAPAAYGVYLSTDPNIGEKGGYGDGSVVRVRCRVKDLELDDQFPDGRMDFSVQQKTYKPVRIFHHIQSENIGFRRWLVFNEDVSSKKAEFVQFFKGMFPGAEITTSANSVKGIAVIGDRNLIAHWYPGTDGRRIGDEKEATESIVKIDFFYHEAGDKGDYMGDISKGGVSEGGLGFMRKLMLLLRGLKKLDIHIYFDAQGMDRADSYASLAMKAGFTLGSYKGFRQMWLAHPVDGVSPTENPYEGGAMARKKERQAAEAKPVAPAPGSIQIKMT